MDSEDEMQDAWAGTSDGEFVNEEEDEESDALASDDDNDESDYGFDYSNVDDLHPSSRLPQVLSLRYSSSGSWTGRFCNACGFDCCVQGIQCICCLGSSSRF